MCIGCTSGLEKSKDQTNAFSEHTIFNIIFQLHEEKEFRKVCPFGIGTITHTFISTKFPIQ